MPRIASSWKLAQGCARAAQHDAAARFPESLIDAFFVNQPILPQVVALFVLLFNALPRLWKWAVSHRAAVDHGQCDLGADTTTIDRTSAVVVIESEMNGVDDRLHLSSVKRANGTAQTTATPSPGTDLGVARVARCRTGSSRDCWPSAGNRALRPAAS